MTKGKTVLSFQVLILNMLKTISTWKSVTKYIHENIKKEQIHRVNLFEKIHLSKALFQKKKNQGI